MSNFPASLDTSSNLPNIGSNALTNSPDHAGQHSLENQAIIAIESKLGTQSSTPGTAGQVLTDQGGGNTAWEPLPTIPVSGGGTGATTASGARSNLSAAQSGINTDITSLSSPTIITPTIASFVNAQHNHSNAAGGGQLGAAALTTDSSWNWQPWSLVFSGLSGGTLNFATFAQIGKTVFFKAKYTLAGAGVSGSVTFNLPVTASANNDARTIFGSGYANVSAGAFYLLQVSSNSSTSGILLALNVGSTYIQATALSASIPITWASGSILAFQGSYEAA